MKVTLDLDKLLQQQKIDRAQYEQLSAYAAHSTSNMAFNILIGFGVLAVSMSALALVPHAIAAIVMGLLILMSGLLVLRKQLQAWFVLANICLITGSLMNAGGLLWLFEAHLLSILSVSGLFALVAYFAKSRLLAVFATLMLSAALGARGGYSSASYGLLIEEPLLSIVLFSLLAVVLHLLAKKISFTYQPLLYAASRCSVFLVNFGFWVGSLWGEKFEHTQIEIADYVFALLWFMALLVAGIWAWRVNHRWLLNTLACFAGIHFYTQWFEYFGAEAWTLLLAGLFALAMALALKKINQSLQV